ncbi:beta-ketoacyl synthase chain length factor [Desulfovibrio desulfuricans]|uniref:beta-ketoacyl synthase chain length factor n=1 Tax=Desulfovibrio desulfuricans TaxID=876 RepID=UPI001F38BFA4|nr:beta-ketoacyl synthase chain length factor [Desulfovibrio desulfuricans]UIA99428.1 beta-ketoacyl synthase chain length factor [Desulfovibrio desulfuricans]
MSSAALSVAGTGLVHSIGGKEALAAIQQGQAPAISAPDISSLAALLPGVSLRRIPRYARMALLACVQALDAAGWRQKEVLHRAALVFGTAYSSSQMSMDFMDSILDNGPHLSSPTAFSHAVNNMGAGLLSLLLGIEGPCFTISQFELSFAGAVSTAAALLGAGRAERVLLCAVDETDSRFSRCCPEYLSSEHPQTEGAVALCLGREAAGAPSLRVWWGQQPEADGPVFASGAASRPGWTNHEYLYGHGPLAQALDVMLALNMPQTARAEAVNCVCAAAASGRQALIEVRGA